MTPCSHRVHDDETDRMTLVIRYEMVRQGEEPVTVLTGKSEHVFLNRAGRFVRMKREMPELARLLSGLAEIH